MKFEFKKDYCNIIFTKQDIDVINKKGKMSLDFKNTKHLANFFAYITKELHLFAVNNKPELKETTNTIDTNVKDKDV